jgi:hypothetical protein
VLNWHWDQPSVYSSVSGRTVKVPAKILSPDEYVYSLETSDEIIPWHVAAAKHDKALLAVEEFLRDPTKRCGARYDPTCERNGSKYQKFVRGVCLKTTW